MSQRERPSRIDQGGPDRLLRVLNDEWEAITGAHRDTIEWWARRHGDLAGCHDLDDVLAAIRAQPDRVLLALLDEHRRGGAAGDLAGRVVLQTMLGKMVLLAVNDARTGLGDYITQLWLVIHRYPVDRRPRRVAANLALDTLKAVVAEDPARRAGVSVSFLGDPQRMDRVVTAATETRNRDHNAVAGVSAWRAVTTAWQIGVINRQERDVLLQVYVDGCTGRQAAARLQTSPDMVRQLCCRAKRRLVSRSAELVAAA